MVRTVSASIESRTAIYDELDTELSSVHAARETLLPLADELSEIDSAVRSGLSVAMLDAYSARMYSSPSVSDCLITGSRRSSSSDGNYHYRSAIRTFRGISTSPNRSAEHIRSST